MIASLDQGLWTPYLQMHDCGALGLTSKTFPGSVGVGKDSLKNETKNVMILRAISSTYGWTDTRRYSYDLTFRPANKSPYKLAPNTTPNCPPTNVCTGLYGSAAVATYPYVFKLARPCRVGLGETILFEFGNVEDEVTYYWAATTGDKVSSCMIMCRGAESGDSIQLGKAETIASGSTSKVTYVWQNQTGEPVDIESITIVTGDATTDRPLFSMEIAGRRWSRAEMPLWLFGDPFKYSRLDLSRLPEGGLIFKPGDSIELTIRGYLVADAASFLTLGLELYQQVA